MDACAPRLMPDVLRTFLIEREGQRGTLGLTTAMHFFHRELKYDMDDEWWAQAGMIGFLPVRCSFRVDPSECAGLTVVDVPIDDVEPLNRSLSHGIFNDDGPKRTARDRVVRILQGFRNDAPMPPIGLLRAPVDSQYRFTLYHGAHRFYCAVAAGFSHVPAVDVTSRPAVHLDLDTDDA